MAAELLLECGQTWVDIRQEKHHDAVFQRFSDSKTWLFHCSGQRNTCSDLAYQPNAIDGGFRE